MKTTTKINFGYIEILELFFHIVVNISKKCETEQAPYTNYAENSVK